MYCKCQRFGPKQTKNLEVCIERILILKCVRVII